MPSKSRLLDCQLLLGLHLFIHSLSQSLRISPPNTLRLELRLVTHTPVRTHHEPSNPKLQSPELQSLSDISSPDDRPRLANRPRRPGVSYPYRDTSDQQAKEFSTADQQEWQPDEESEDSSQTEDEF